MRSRSCHVRKTAVVFLLLLCQCTTSACSTGATSISCPLLQAENIHRLQFGVQDANDIVNWIMETYKIDSQAIARDSYRDGVTSLAWSTRDARYSAWFRQEKLTSVETFWKSRLPTVGDALRCLGQPALYRAEYTTLPEAMQFDFGLWYPDRGTVVSAGQILHEDQPPVVTGDTQIASMAVTAPGRIGDVVANALVLGYSAEVRDAVLPTLKPWPGSIDAIKVHIQ